MMYEERFANNSDDLEAPKHCDAAMCSDFLSLFSLCFLVYLR